MVRRFLPLALIAAATVSVAFACMAMQPTHPSTMRPPPPVTTTDTTTTTSSTTTTPTPTCDGCSDVVYKVPEAATCGGDSFYCTDDDLLSRTLTGSCKTATCTSGRLFAYDSSGSTQPVTGDLTCAFKTPAIFEDDSAPPLSFPDGASVFCKAETACEKCPMLEYSKNNDVESEENFVNLPFLGKHGCPVKECLRYQLRYEDQSAILHSVTCNPALPGFIDRMKTPVTKAVGCYDCACTVDNWPSSILCPPEEYIAVSKCQSMCSPGDLFITYMPGMADNDGFRAPAEEVFCDLSNNWQPFGKPELLFVPTCATPTDRMATTQPASDVCPPLEQLDGGNFSNIIYHSIVDESGGQVIFAVCRSGMITSTNSDPTSGRIFTSSFVFCDSADGKWLSYSGHLEATKATCRQNSCVDFMLNVGGYTQEEINMINVVEEAGRCRATCKNGEPFKVEDGDVPPKSLVIFVSRLKFATDDNEFEVDRIIC